MRNQMTVTTTYDDGHVQTWTYDQPGSAQDAHDALARRWKEAGLTFGRDRAARILMRSYEAENRGEQVEFTDVIRHEDIA